MEIGYHLSSEEHPAPNLISHAKSAEEAGFQFATISDHFHPWIDRQGQSPFVWGVLGALAQATERLTVLTAVTCPTIRIHPVIVAQAAATAAQLMPGRFQLGVGTGENLNEHVVGDRWPPGDVRQEMLEEAIDVIRLVWSGDEESHYGRHYTVDHARIYSMPDELPPILVAAKGPKATKLAAEKGDGLIGTSPDNEQLELFRKAGGGDKPTLGMVHVCWAEDAFEALKVAHEWWPNSSIKGDLSVELPRPRHFEQAAEMVSQDDVAKDVTCGPDPEKHIKALKEYEEAGYDRVFVHQVGPEQEGFIRFYSEEVIPKLS